MSEDKYWVRSADGISLIDMAPVLEDGDRLRIGLGGYFFDTDSKEVAEAVANLLEK